MLNNNYNDKFNQSKKLIFKRPKMVIFCRKIDI